MPDVQINLNAWVDGDEQISVSASVIDSNLETVRNFPLSTSKPTRLNLPQGNYTVQATLPSGQSISHPMRVTDAPSQNEVTLESHEISAHEWLSWATITGDVATESAYKAMQKVAMTHDVAHRDTLLFPEDGIWLRFWKFCNDGWETVPWPLTQVSTDAISWSYIIQANYEFLLLQAGGVRTPWRMSLLPPAERVQLLLKHDDPETSDDRGVKMAVNSLDFRIETMMRYLQRGDFDSLKTVGEEVYEDAESMLFFKRRNPLAAAVGAYFLLATQSYDRLHNWPNNFAEWIDWLPDSAVIHGWQLLKQPGKENMKKALERFVDATKRGIPCFSIGLRYLYDGLDYLRRVYQDNQDALQKIDPALNKVAAYANAADWTKVYTTFFGEAPDKPDLLSHTGVPLDWEGLEFLAELNTQQDLQDIYKDSFPPLSELGDLIYRKSFVVYYDDPDWILSERRLNQSRHDETYSGPVDAEVRALGFAKGEPSRLLVYSKTGELETFRIFDSGSDYRGPGGGVSSPLVGDGGDGEAKEIEALVEGNTPASVPDHAIGVLTTLKQIVGPGEHGGAHLKKIGSK